MNPLFNIHEKYREVIIINPYRFSDPDAVAQAARIVADGGTVIDFAFMNLVISTMKSMGIYSSCKLLTEANFGVKKDGSTGAVSKLYDISGNNNDAIGTGTGQPIWSLSGGKGVITYDGVNDYLNCGKPVIPVNNFSILTASKSSVINVVMSLVTQWKAGGANRLDYVYSGDNKLDVIIGGAEVLKSTITIGTNLRHLAYTHSITNVATLYFDGVYNVNGNVSTIQQLSNTLIGTYSVAEWFNGQINSSTIFNIALTQSQITQLTNLGL